MHFSTLYFAILSYLLSDCVQPLLKKINQPASNYVPMLRIRLSTWNWGKKKSGVELLSHTLTYSIIVAGPLNNRVRDGNVCCKTAINTGKKISKRGGREKQNLRITQNFAERKNQLDE